MKTAVRLAPGTITVRIPLAFHKRGGRKLVVTPDGETALPLPRVHIDSALVKALARAHRWKRLLETGGYASVADLAKAERINKSYLCRMLRLTLLSPHIIEGILDGRQQIGWQLPNLMRPFSGTWIEQNSRLSTEHLGGRLR